MPHLMSDTPRAVAAFTVPFALEDFKTPTEADKNALFTTLFAEAQIALSSPNPLHTAETSFTDPKEPSPLLSAACLTCQGLCCRQGLKEHAFIKAPTLRRIATHHPGASAADLAQYYLNKVPRRHMANQCLFQSETGCVLKREERSRVCNTYLCRYARSIESSAPDLRNLEQPVLLISVDEKTVRRANVAQKDEHEVKIYPLNIGAVQAASNVHPGATGAGE